MQTVCRYMAGTKPGEPDSAVRETFYSPADNLSYAFFTSDNIANSINNCAGMQLYNEDSKSPRYAIGAIPSQAASTCTYKALESIYGIPTSLGIGDDPAKDDKINNEVLFAHIKRNMPDFCKFAINNNKNNSFY